MKKVLTALLALVTLLPLLLFAWFPGADEK
jgi:hypothetical protein